MKSNKLLTLIFVSLFSGAMFANGLSLNSVGTRALGMGGAFVGLANDASAIYWNPAGLAGQKSSALLYYTGIMPFATYKMDAANIDAESNTKLYMAPGFFANYTSEKWAFAFGVYVPAGLGTDWNAEDFFGPQAVDNTMLSEIGVISFSPAVAYQISDKLSIGLALNIYYAMFDLEQPVYDEQLGLFQYTESSTGTGFGATLGLKYQATEKLSIGLSFRTSTKVSMSGDATNTMFPNIPNVPPMAPGPEKSTFSRDVTWPMWIAGGFAYKFNDKFTVTFDLQQSFWSEVDKLVAEYDEEYWKQMLEPTEDNVFEMKWENALQIRVGGEYLASKNFGLRFGYYYDPAPAPDETVNVLFPSSTNNVVTGGMSYYGEKFSVILAAEYLFGQERDIEFNNTNEMPGVHQMDVFSFSVGFDYKF